MQGSLTGWDLALIVVVSVMGTAVAYLRHPEHKAFVLLLPVPFTLAMLSVARPIDATNVLGLPLIFGFSFGVWVFHTRWRWPIVVAIATAVAGYGVIGAGVARLDLGGAAAFWIAEAVTMAVALALIRVLPPSDDPHTQTPLPVWVKLPAIALTVAMVIAIKPWLSGFMTMFPMVLAVTSYEARRSLWTIVRRIPWLILVMIPMMAIIRLTQDWIGLPAALALSWPILLALLWLLRDALLPGPTGEGVLYGLPTINASRGDPEWRDAR